MQPRAHTQLFSIYSLVGNPFLQLLLLAQQEEQLRRDRGGGGGEGPLASGGGRRQVNETFSRFDNINKYNRLSALCPSLFKKILS
jgi:hypothetical protein